MNKKKKFSYYKRLSVSQKRIYDKSDSVEKIELPQQQRFSKVIFDLQNSLEIDDLLLTRKTADRLITGLCTVFKVPLIKIKVLNVRPSSKYSVLHGLYETDKKDHIVITVWMRTAKKKQVVAFPTFLRTIIHEFMHHLDYTYLKLEDSFHTPGFYKRESSIYKQLLS